MYTMWGYHTFFTGRRNATQGVPYDIIYDCANNTRRKAVKIFDFGNGELFTAILCDVMCAIYMGRQI